MASSRIRTGFHRLAIVLAVGFLIPAVIAFANAGFLKVMYSDADAGPAIAIGTLCLVAGVGVYILTRAIGWIVEGFVG